MTAKRLILYVGALWGLMALPACSGLYFGDSPGPDVRKESGPLTQPPPSLRDGTARDGVVR